MRRYADMERRRIGSLEVSVVGLGCNNFGWRIDAAETRKVVDAALDAGVDFFDTADVYGGGQSEEFLRPALAGRRDRVVLASKFGMKFDDERQGARPEYVKQAAEASLRRLGTDRIDLYQLHQPDRNVPIADTLGALDDLVRAGKVREIGCSNFPAEQLREADNAALATKTARFASVQNEYSLLVRDVEKDVLPECLHRGLGFVPYFPLASGLLTGKYRLGQPAPSGSRAAAGFGPKVFTDENLALVESLIGFAESRGHTLLELAVSWLVSQPGVASVIAGATSADQVRMNAKAAGWNLTPADLQALDRIFFAHPHNASS